MSSIGQAAMLVSVPVVAAGVGSTVAVLRPPSSRVVSGVQHFAAGVVIAALAGEVLPDLKAEGSRGWAVLGFSAGVILMLALAAYGRRVDARRAQVAKASVAIAPVGLLAAVAVDLLVDGALVWLGSTLGAAQGLIITAALTIEVLFLGLSVAGELTQLGMNRLKATLTCWVLGLLTAVGALGAVVLLDGAPTAALATVLAFGAAALLYLAVEELLVYAHEERETVWLSALFFIGFLLVYALAQEA